MLNGYICTVPSYYIHMHNYHLYMLTLSTYLSSPLEIRDNNNRKMPSSGNRKKNKGKVRKAKKEEAERALVHSTLKDWANGLRGDGTVVTQCNHGLAEVPDASHPVSSFMHTFFYGDRNKEIHKHTIRMVATNLIDNNECYRKLAVQMLIRIAASNLIYSKGVDVCFAWGLTTTIMALENYDERFDVNDNYCLARRHRIVLPKNRVVGVGTSKREVLKFYRKRMNCKCLKKMHLEARKTLPKLGACAHCYEVKERDLLMACSRCMICEYCSKECQVAASPNHRGVCDKFFGTHEEQQQANDTS